MVASCGVCEISFLFHRPARQTRARLRVLREADLDYVLLDGALAECDRVGDSQAGYSHKHRRHGVNVQVVTDPAGRLLWISPALPGRALDRTAARTHRIVQICERQGVPVLVDRAYLGAGPQVTTPLKRPPGRDPHTNPTNRHPRALGGTDTGGAGRSPFEVLVHLPQRPVHPTRMSSIAEASSPWSGNAERAQ